MAKKSLIETITGFFARIKHTVTDKWIPGIKNWLRPQVLNAVIAVDPQLELVHFYVMDETEEKKIHHQVVNYRAKSFESKFFEKLQSMIKTYQEEHPTCPLQKVSIVLPDSVCVTDTVHIPVIQKRAMENSLTLAINSLHKNCDDLAFTTFPIAQNRQFATFGVVGVKEDILSRMVEACESSGVSIANISFAANTSANAVMALNSKARNDSFLLLDIKETRTKIAFVVNGKTMGYYALPFGHAILSPDEVNPEDMLFEHDSAELLVLNAKEKAKAKQLTMAAVEEMEGDLTEEGGEEVEEETPAEEGKSLTVKAKTYESLRKRGPRKLPKFMQRPEPTSREGYECENFRIFQKWALDLIASNPSIFNIDAPKAVFVNMPRKYDHVLDTVNDESSENGVMFLPVHGGTDVEPAIAKHLQLYGAFYVKQYNRGNNF